MHDKKTVRVNGTQFDKSNPNSRTLIPPPIFKNPGALFLSKDRTKK